MKARKILFPTDFSPFGQEALRWATSLARDTGATLVIVHVEEPPMAYGGGEMYLGAEEGDREVLRKALVKVAHNGYQCAVRAQAAHWRSGNGDRRGRRRSRRADFIVMGTHGRTGLNAPADGQRRRSNRPQGEMPGTDRQTSRTNANRNINPSPIGRGWRR